MHTWESSLSSLRGSYGADLSMESVICFCEGCPTAILVICTSIEGCFSKISTIGIR
jgi:hypothetical protein